jgi:hypothetical protein
VADGDRFDVFLSYSHADADWAEALARRLEQEGFHIFLDRWEIAPGDIVVHSVEAGILASTHGVVVFSPDSVAAPWFEQEYAAMMHLAITEQLRFISVLHRPVDLPLFAASRRWIDFRGADGPVYEQRLTQLVRGLRGQPEADRPQPGGPEARPPGSQQVAWKLFVETVTRISTQPLDDRTGSIREALTSLYGLFETTRDSLKQAQPSRPGAGPTVEQLAITMLNLELRPFLSRWHPALQDWEQTHPGATEADWPANAECRTALRAVQQGTLAYALGFARLAGLDDTTAQAAVGTTAQAAVGTTSAGHPAAS